MSISYASDGPSRAAGVVVDDIVVSTGAGHDVVRERRQRPRRLGRRPGAPDGSAAEREHLDRDGIVAAVPTPLGVERPERRSTLQPEIIGLESEHVRAVPVLGGRRHRRRRRGRLRAREPDPADLLAGLLRRPDAPTTTSSSTSSPTSGTATASPSTRWQDIWLNEGFATYAEWLWSEQEGDGHRAGDLRLLVRASRPTTRSGRSTIGDPGTGPAVRLRRLRPRRDDAARAPRRRSATDVLPAPQGLGAAANAGGNVTTEQFIALAESISGRAARRPVRRVVRPGSAGVAAARRYGRGGRSGRRPGRRWRTVARGGTRGQSPAGDPAQDQPRQPVRGGAGPAVARFAGAVAGPWGARPPRHDRSAVRRGSAEVRA